MTLKKNKIKADAIHGNKSQQRTKTMHNFKSGQLRVPIATDIAARGIDIDDKSHVINYDLPNEPESYVHRIGRTGRAGAEGTAYSFCAANERSLLRSIERLTQREIAAMEHQYHSGKAKNAVGVAAEPAPNRSQVIPRNSKPESMHRSGPRRSYPVRRSQLKEGLQIPERLFYIQKNSRLFLFINFELVNFLFGKVT